MGIMINMLLVVWKGNLQILFNKLGLKMCTHKYTYCIIVYIKFYI